MPESEFVHYVLSQGPWDSPQKHPIVNPFVIQLISQRRLALIYRLRESGRRRTRGRRSQPSEIFRRAHICGARGQNVAFLGGLGKRL